MRKPGPGQNPTESAWSAGARAAEAASVGLTFRDRPFWLAAFVLLERCGGDASLRALQQVQLALADEEIERARDWELVLRAVRHVEQLGSLPN
jgi:hypothetical protein